MIAEKRKIMPDFCNRRCPFHYITALNLLAGMKIDINKIDILASGEYENYKGEILAQEPEPGTVLTKDSRIMLKVGFSSAVDYMPYQFFYGLSGIRQTDASWEENSRKLLAPFDAAVIRHNAEARYQSLKYDYGVIDSEHFRRIIRIFGIKLPPDMDSIDDMLFWLSILPSFHYWAGNPGLTEKALEMLFGFTFEIVENSYSVHEIPPSLHYHLGTRTGRLGREVVLGRQFSEYDSGYEVIIKNVEPNQVRELLPAGKIRKKIEWVLTTCMPNNLTYQIRIKVNRPGVSVAGEEIQKGYLGYSTFI